MENNIFSSNYNNKLMFSYDPLLIIENFQFFNFQACNNHELIDTLNSYILKFKELKKPNPIFLALLCEEIKYRDINSNALFESSTHNYSCVNLTNYFYLVDNKSLRVY